MRWRGDFQGNSKKIQKLSLEENFWHHLNFCLFQVLIATPSQVNSLMRLSEVLARNCFSKFLSVCFRMTYHKCGNKYLKISPLLFLWWWRNNILLWRNSVFLKLQCRNLQQTAIPLVYTFVSIILLKFI
ncbi:hypothetical protein M9H77_30878 [Catharanthus roseus]|uniref:Uncharacterized protein n=1 Tax=Catharanthus roseus TaxID=4058 RepID=A0ACB9ZZG2_CATRO|nr:hypothetical protein M9H77_30878 [Catharanthus roseus]